MNRRLFIAGLLAGLVSAEPALAQTRLKLHRPQIQRPGKMPNRPSMPPSLLMKQFQRSNPGAKILKLKRLPNGDTVVTFRRNNQLNRTVLPSE